MLCAGSAEFQQKFVGQTDTAFTDRLYLDAMGRHAHAAGLQGRTSALARGASRGEVALGVTQSAEAQQHFAAIAAQGRLVG